MSRPIKIVTALLLLSLVFYWSAAARPIISLADRARAVLALPVWLLKNLRTSAALINNLQSLQAENQKLRGELLARSLGVPVVMGRFAPAKVYAIYPSNDRSTITVAVGANEGVKVGAPVLTPGGFYIGQVTAVFDHWSEVRTLFDAGKNTPVRLGEKGAMALLAGGSGVRATMINRSVSLAGGETIYLVAKGLPYGLLIGEVGTIYDVGGGIFKEVEVVLPYQLADLETVEVWRGDVK